MLALPLQLGEFVELQFQFRMQLRLPQHVQETRLAQPHFQLLLQHVVDAVGHFSQLFPLLRYQAFHSPDLLLAE